MDYEKKYKEALEKARKLYNEAKANDYMSNMEDYENIFPELKESEDEKIRKELLALIEWSKSYAASGITTDKAKEMISWLEKQGEQKPTLPKWKFKKDNTPLLRDSLILNKYGCVARSPADALVSDVWVIDYDELAKLPKEEYETKGEQKPVNKVEPKFKVGDWVIGHATNNESRQISKIADQYYISTYGGQYGFSFEDEMHLWTIQDAKDGDVLYSPCCKLLFIFKHDKECYVGYNINYHTESVFVNSPICIPSDSIPATKEQRDLLFKKMEEAGYECDDEKKELELLITNGGDFDTKNCEQNPFWSEEDETALGDALWCCKQAASIAKDENDMGNVWYAGNWLKSIKERIGNFDDGYKVGFSAAKHNQWKPSEEQLEALDEVIRNRDLTTAEYKGLLSLWKEIKEFREE